MKKLFPALLALFLLGSCKKEDSKELPAATQTGANTIGCKIDGEPFVTSGDPDVNLRRMGVEFVQFSGSNARLWINAKQHTPRQNIELNFPFKGELGQVELNGEASFGGVFHDLSGNTTGVSGENEFRTTAEHKGYVNVTKFTGAIISGTFEFDAVNESGRVVHITEGRFDIASE